MRQIKTKLVAIAKDEAAYLPEWIAHHLFVGFDEIEVQVNRTSDNTLALLTSISVAYPQVRFKLMDWLDVCAESVRNNIQFISQALAIEEAKLDNHLTHICFLDVDEFWIDINKCRKVNQFISDLGRENAIYIPWVNDFPNEKPFSSLEQAFTGNLSVLGKCVYPLNISFKQLHLHRSEIEAEYILPNGKRPEFDRKAVQALREEQRSLQETIIYHRSHRSAMEYVSLLFRGRPSDLFPYKRNRKGLPRVIDSTVSIVLNSQYMLSRRECLDAMYVHCGASALERARNYVENRYRLSLDQIPSTIVDHYDVMVEMFRGVRLSGVVEHFANHRQKLLKQFPRDVDKIRQLAKDASHQSINEAVLLIKLAHSLRPNGPLINKLKRRYLEMQADSDKVV